jgi:hypothetical protein
MIKTRIERTERPFLPATAAGKRFGRPSAWVAQSRAAARSLVVARNGVDADAEWDRPLSMDGVAEALDESIPRPQRD